MSPSHISVTETLPTSIIIATYGEERWRDVAWSRAYPSTEGQGAVEVIVEHEPEMTIAQVRNKLGAKASSEWLCFLDADDELMPGYLEATARAHRFVASRGHISRPLYTPMVAYVHGVKRRHPLHLRPTRGNLRDNNYLVIGTIVQRALFLEVGGFSDYPHGFEDWSLWAKCWKAGAEVVRTNAVYVAYIDPNSKHRQAWKDTRWQTDMHHKVRSELFPELYEKGVRA